MIKHLQKSFCLIIPMLSEQVVSALMVIRTVAIVEQA